jgi:hypothetical protein
MPSCFLRTILAACRLRATVPLESYTAATWIRSQSCSHRTKNSINGRVAKWNTHVAVCARVSLSFGVSLVVAFCISVAFCLYFLLEQYYVIFVYIVIIYIWLNLVFYGIVVAVARSRYVGVVVVGGGGAGVAVVSLCCGCVTRFRAPSSCAPLARVRFALVSLSCGCASRCRAPSSCATLARVRVAASFLLLGWSFGAPVASVLPCVVDSSVFVLASKKKRCLQKQLMCAIQLSPSYGHIKTIKQV